MSDDLDRRLRERLGGLDLPSAPSTLHDAMDRLGAEPPGRPHPRWRGALRAAPVLAVAVVVVAVLAWGSGLRLGVSPGSTPSASTEGTPGQSPTTPSTASPGLATENPRPSGSIVPWLHQSAFTAPSPTPVVIPSGTPTCLPSDLTASAGWQGGGGQMLGWLAVTNVGQHPCVLQGSPRLVELRSGKTIVEPITYHGEPSDGSSDASVIAGPVLLEPGGAAGAFLWWSNWCGTTTPVVTSLDRHPSVGRSPHRRRPAVVRASARRGAPLRRAIRARPPSPPTPSPRSRRTSLRLRRSRHRRCSPCRRRPRPAPTSSTT